MDQEEAVPQEQVDGADLEQKSVTIPFPENFTYVNCAAFSISHLDIRIGFAEVMPDGKASPRVGIVMPPETAAIVALILMKQVQTYEKTFGEIRHPAWKAAKAVLKAAKLGPEVVDAQ